MLNMSSFTKLAFCGMERHCKCVLLVTLVCQIVSHLHSPATHISVSVVQSPRTCEQQITAYEHSLKINEMHKHFNSF